jgi:hypothetical protein
MYNLYKLDKMDTQNIKGTIVQSKEGNLTLRIWLTEQQKELFCLQNGKTTSFGEVIVFPSKEEGLTRTKRQEAFDIKWEMEKANKQ